MTFLTLSSCLVWFGLIQLLLVGFVVCFFESILSTPGYIQTCKVTKASFEFLILLTLPRKYQNHRNVPPHWDIFETSHQFSKYSYEYLFFIICIQVSTIGVQTFLPPSLRETGIGELHSEQLGQKNFSVLDHLCPSLPRVSGVASCAKGPQHQPVSSRSSPHSVKQVIPAMTGVGQGN